MAAIFIGQEDIDIRPTGTSVSVPNYDVCRLSYYLKCGTVSCGLDINVDELLDFKNAHRLPEARQDAIFKLAYDDFDIETLGNVTIFLLDDDNDILPTDSNNEFYDISQVQNILAIQEDAIIGGKHTKVRKIMICNKHWLEKFYLNPLKNNMDRVRRTMSGTTSAGDLLAALLATTLLLGNDSDDEGRSAAGKHCSHCKGLDAKCSCEHGCPKKVESQCKVVHSGVLCDSCRTPAIEGPRYKCNECYNYDLCERCYNKGVHKTHAFEMYARVGSTATFPPPRQEPVKHKHCSHCDGAEGKCKCTHGCVSTDDSLCKVVHDVTCRACTTMGIQGPCYKCSDCWEVYLCQKCYDAGEHVLTHSFVRYARVGSAAIIMPPRAASSPAPEPKQRPSPEVVKPSSSPPTKENIPIATAVNVQVVFETGQPVTLVNMSHKNRDMEGVGGVVVKNHGSRVIVEVPSLSKKVTVKPENLELNHSPLAVGSLVELKNLSSKADHNGRLATVTKGIDAKGRIQVRLLDDESRELKVKPENLESIEDL